MESYPLQQLKNIVDPLGYTPKMPALFLGHGSPLNAISDNEFTQGFSTIAKTLPRPYAILVISAHWETKGTFVTAMKYPKTIHDFYGFPEALYQVQYPVEGSEILAKATKELIKTSNVGLTLDWGLDHGAWSVLKFLYPKADVPVIQMSIDYTKTNQFHYDLAAELKQLRHKGVLIVGSGNTIHNLRELVWDKINVSGYGFDWALEVNHKIAECILTGNHKDLINYSNSPMHYAFDLAVPTKEHYLPLLYILALQDKGETVKIFNDQLIGGSLGMMSLQIG